MEEGEKLDRLAGQLQAVLLELTRLGGTVESIRADVARTTRETNRELADKEQRIRSLERNAGEARGFSIGWTAAFSGVAALVSAIVSTLYFTLHH